MEKLIEFRETLQLCQNPANGKRDMKRKNGARLGTGWFCSRQSGINCFCRQPGIVYLHGGWCWAEAVNQ
jgi:hypothetical protein